MSLWLILCLEQSQRLRARLAGDADLTDGITLVQDYDPAMETRAPTAETEVLLLSFLRAEGERPLALLVEEHAGRPMKK